MSLKFGVSEAWVRRIKQERREQGKTAPLMTRRRIPIWVKEADQIRAAIVKSPDLTLDELKVELKTTLSRTTLCCALQHLRLTLKKSPDRQRTAPAGRGAASSRVARLAGRLVRSQSRRTVEGLWTLCGQISQLFHEPECRRHFQHCGYRYS